MPYQYNVRPLALTSLSAWSGKSGDETIQESPPPPPLLFQGHPLLKMMGLGGGMDFSEETGYRYVRGYRSLPVPCTYKIFPMPEYLSAIITWEEKLGWLVRQVGLLVRLVSLL